MRLKPKDLALMISFAALYAVLSSVSLFPIVGDVGRFITLASALAPLTGIILGPNVGALAVSIGGFIGWSITQTGTFSFLSFVPGMISAFGSGLLYNGRRRQSIVLYTVLFLSLAFFPTIGPAWLYPYFLWFQLTGLAVLASPLTRLAVNYTRKDSNLASLGFGVGVVSLVSTLFGQMTGNLMFELTRWPTIYPQVEYWRVAQWQFLTFVYPVERAIITLMATVVGVPLIRAIRAYGFEMGGQ